MGLRKELHEILKGLMDEGERENVYFQPPPSVIMKYPAIVYQRDSARTEFADNNPYTYNKRYTVTVIDRNPDSEIPDRVAQLPKCLHTRFFTSSNLNHDVFSLYF